MEPDSAKPDFWNHRYAAETTPWDYHGVPGQVNAYLANAEPARVLIPGSGSGNGVAAFHAAGWDVQAIDFSALAVERARNILGPIGNRVVSGDFFVYPFGESVFDVVYERTFLCALPPHRRTDYAARMRQLIRPGGKLVGFFFYGEGIAGPPYPISESRAIELLGRDFTRTRDEPVADSLPIFVGKERWQKWTLKSD